MCRSRTPLRAWAARMTEGLAEPHGRQLASRLHVHARRRVHPAPLRRRVRPATLAHPARLPAATPDSSRPRSQRQHAQHHRYHGAVTHLPERGGGPSLEVLCLAQQS